MVETHRQIKRRLRLNRAKRKRRQVLNQRIKTFRKKIDLNPRFP